MNNKENKISNDPIERAKAQAGQRYPRATITTRSVRGRPVVLAYEGNLIRLIGLSDRDAVEPKQGRA